MTEVSVRTKAGRWRIPNGGSVARLRGHLDTALSGLPSHSLARAKSHGLLLPHAWASAHFATIAQAFASHGIIGLHGAPIENFDPLTSQPDNYLHFPPFFFYVLSLVLDAFPDSIRAMHLFMALVAIASACVMWIIASMFFKPRAAIVCGCAFLLMPATLRYGLLLYRPTWPCWRFWWRCCLCCVTCKCRCRARTVVDLGLSALAFFLACFTSWEPFLALPGLLLAYGFNRRSEIFKTGVCWAIAASAAGASTLAIFSSSDPAFFSDLWSIFTFRLGLTQYLPLSTRVHPVEGQLETVGSLNVFSSAPYFFDAYVVRTQVFSGSLGIVGIFALF